ncbi:MAG: hypothetical protein KDD62_15915, partial [Bdellovibrionales bacterium]|nr:hypothetical protein [Bdellovibrionales bacterium]
MDDILGEIARHGFAYKEWAMQPVRIYGFQSANPRIAVDANLEVYNKRDYGYSVLKSYFFISIIRHLDNTFLAQDLEGYPGIYGKWIIYDNTSQTSLSASQRSYFMQSLKQAFDVDNNGRYLLSIFQLAH